MLFVMTDSNVSYLCCRVRGTGILLDTAAHKCRGGFGYWASAPLFKRFPLADFINRCLRAPWVSFWMAWTAPWYVYPILRKGSGDDGVVPVSVRLYTKHLLNWVFTSLASTLKQDSKRYSKIIKSDEHGIGTVQIKRSDRYCP